MNATQEHSDVGSVISGGNAQPQEPQGRISPPVVPSPIGTGEHAQNTIVYIVIRLCFVAGTVISIACYLGELYRANGTPASVLKDVWAIFAPIITLALGYMFGRGRGGQ